MIQLSVDSGWIAGAVGFIARDGKIVYDKSFGVNDMKAKTQMRSDDIFPNCFPDKRDYECRSDDVI